MLDPEALVCQLKENGFSFFSGVPCSYLKGLINCAMDQGDYIAAVNEGDAVAVCAGAYMAGRNAVVMMQNSGLMNAVSPLTSLTQIFHIPVLGFVSLRGDENFPDEPQHELTGKITIPLLELIRIRWDFLSDNPDDAKDQVNRAIRNIGNGESFFFVVRKNTVALYPAPSQKKEPERIPKKVSRSTHDELPKRIDVLRVIDTGKDHRTLILTTTGYTSRELAEMGNAGNHFYLIGSMGCVASLGLGLSLAKPGRFFIAVDGDGALLMRLGSLATIGHYNPKNLLHILLDNNSYESTGGQSTVSDTVDFVGIAASCGYANSVYAHNTEELSRKISAWRENPELTFIHLRIQQGTKEKLGRPTVPPQHMREQAMKFLRSGNDPA